MTANLTIRMQVSQCGRRYFHILRDCGYLVDYDTVYVLVDTRDLADHAARDPGLPHWQAAVAWFTLVGKPFADDWPHGGAH